MPDDTITHSLEIQASSLRSLHRDWRARCNGRRCPARADFDPLELRYILGQLSLIDVLRDPLRFVFRLHASNNAARLGVDLTGKEIGQIPKGAAPAKVRAQYEEAVQTRMPVVRYYKAVLVGGMNWEYELLLLPLASDGETVDMMMAGMSWTPR